MEYLNEKSRLVKTKQQILEKPYYEALHYFKFLRIIKIDGIPIVIHKDLHKDRCNVILENGIITEISGFY